MIWFAPLSQGIEPEWSQPHSRIGTVFRCSDGGDGDRITIVPRAAGCPISDSFAENQQRSAAYRTISDLAENAPRQRKQSDFRSFVNVPQQVPQQYPKEIRLCCRRRNSLKS